MTKELELFLVGLSHEHRWNVLLNAVERLIELEEVSYLPDGDDMDESIIWDACGESLTYRGIDGWL